MRKLRGESGVMSQHNSSCYMDLLPQEKQQLAANLWQAVTSLLAQELAKAAQGVCALLDVPHCPFFCPAQDLLSFP